jgi:orotidine-5'-phosphate decarboxylase
MEPKPIACEDRLIFAMDVPDVDNAKALATELGDAVMFYKLGLELMMTGRYFELLDWLTGRGKKVFADLKFYDIPATVGRAVKGLSQRNATFATVHGNHSIMKAAAENKGDLKILAVTVLTSIDQNDLNEMGYQRDLSDLVVSRAQDALDCGCDGVISSGQEAPRLRESIDHRLLVVTPGIRPASQGDTGDQKRVVTVDQAFRNGADYIVVGRPVRDAEQPRAAAESIQQMIAEAFSS